MTKTEVTLGREVITYTFAKLPPEERIQIVKDLEKATRKERWDPLIKKIRKRAAKNPLFQKEIDRLCEVTRQQLYEKRAKGSN